MRKRKERTEERSEIDKEGEGTEEIDKEGDQKGFFACYLLCSLCPRFKGHTYIGFTVNPCRRIKQHNGEMTSGAWRTKRKRPWEMVLCIYGFPTNVSALQFEWAWQHPRESLAVRKAAASFTSFSGIAKHIKLAYTMLTLPPWQSLKLIVNFFSTKYTSHCAGCPSLPKQMKVQVCAMDELPCYIEGNQLFDENEAEEEEEDKDDGSGNSNEHISERLINTSVDNTAAVDQNINHDWEKWTEDDCLRHPNSPSEEDNEIPDTGFDNQSPLMNRNLSFSSEDRFGRLAGSFTQKHDEECGRSYSLVDSPVGTPLSSISKTAVIDEDRDRFQVDEERSELQSGTPKVTDNDQPPSSSKSFDSSPEVEVISLLTPSPNSIVHYFRKKKRPSSDIIDLTKSPMFVQL